MNILHVLPNCIFSRVGARRSSLRNLTSKSNSFRRILAPVSVGSLTSNGVFCLTVADSIATPDSKTTKGTTTNMADCCIVLNLLGNKRSNMEPSFYIPLSPLFRISCIYYTCQNVSDSVLTFAQFISSYYKQINFILNEALIKMSDTSPAVQFSKWLFSCIRCILERGRGGVKILCYRVFNHYPTQEN